MITEVRSSVDSWADQQRPSKEPGSSSVLKLNDTTGSNAKFGYIYFAPPFPLGATIIAATLRLILAKPWGGAQALTGKRIVDSWREGRLKWNNRPSVDAANAGSVNVSALAAGDEVEIDLTAMLAAVAAGGKWFGVRLEIDGNADREIASSDHPRAEWHPVLEIEWSEAPQPPTNLAPGGGRAISKQKPLLTWQFVDNVGSTVQSSSQVQISTTPDFTAPEYDSGKIANTLSAWDLAATAYAGLADNDVRYWRVKVWDGTDLASDWSATEQFERQDKGSLTITNPDAPPANTVEETTPPMAWTLTGATQEAFAAFLYRVGAGGALTLLTSQAKVATTDIEWEVPAGILRTGDTYRVLIRVWDDVDRQAVAGDPDYVQATRDFTYVRSGAPAPVTALTATPDGAKVVLEFERTTDPDYFAIRVDGVEVLDRIEPGDVFVSGDSYSFDYWLARPRQSHEFEVEAVVNDAGVLQHSDGNATATAETNPIGIWLADPVESLGVFLAGKEKAQIGIGEIGGLFDVQGSRAPVRITEALRGYEGSLNGILTEYAGMDAIAARNAFLELKGRLTTLRLIIGDLNLPVELGEVTGPLPARDADLGYDVGFEFAQVDEFEEAFEVAGE